jgi:hypothetical protein
VDDAVGFVGEHRSSLPAAAPPRAHRPKVPPGGAPVAVTCGSGPE